MSTNICGPVSERSTRAAPALVGGQAGGRERRRERWCQQNISTPRRSLVRTMAGLASGSSVHSEDTLVILSATLRHRLRRRYAALCRPFSFNQGCRALVQLENKAPCPDATRVSLATPPTGTGPNGSQWEASNLTVTQRLNTAATGPAGSCNDTVSDFHAVACRVMPRAARYLDC